MVKENMESNEDHLYYDELSNEILYLDHVYVINLNLYLNMVNVVDMTEREYPKILTKFTVRSHIFESKSEKFDTLW